MYPPEIVDPCRQDLTEAGVVEMRTALDVDSVLKEAQGTALVVIKEDQLDGEIEEVVEAILRNSPNAVRAAKQLIFDVAGKPITEDLMQMTSERIAEARASEQGKEGLSAFLEKRPPAWIRK